MRVLIRVKLKLKTEPGAGQTAQELWENVLDQTVALFMIYHNIHYANYYSGAPAGPRHA
jgi:hypothetical protein